jgi:hypothetical protein
MGLALRHEKWQLAEDPQQGVHGCIPKPDATDVLSDFHEVVGLLGQYLHSGESRVQPELAQVFQHKFGPLDGLS